MQEREKRGRSRINPARAVNGRTGKKERCDQPQQQADLSKEREEKGPTSLVGWAGIENEMQAERGEDVWLVCSVLGQCECHKSIDMIRKEEETNIRMVIGRMYFWSNQPSVACSIGSKFPGLLFSFLLLLFEKGANKKVIILDAGPFLFFFLFFFFFFKIIPYTIINQP